MLVELELSSTRANKTYVKKNGDFCAIFTFRSGIDEIDTKLGSQDNYTKNKTPAKISFIA